jgi:hypothetical protein
MFGCFGTGLPLDFNTCFFTINNFGIGTTRSFTFLAYLRGTVMAIPLTLSILLISYFFLVSQSLTLPAR